MEYPELRLPQEFYEVPVAYESKVVSTALRSHYAFTG